MIIPVICNILSSKISATYKSFVVSVIVEFCGNTQSGLTKKSRFETDSFSLVKHLFLFVEKLLI